MKKLTVFITILACLLLSGCGQVTNMMNISPTEIEVMTVSSLKEPLEEIKTAFEKKENITLDYEFANSEEITDDLIEGELTDFIILSSQKNMDQLVSNSLIDNTSRQVLVSNTLVVAVAADSEITTFDELQTWQVNQIIIGDPETTSSGRYVTNTLDQMGLSGDLNYKIAYEKNIRLLIDSLRKSNTDAGIVFKSDAVNNEAIKIIYEFPVDSYDTINYPMAISSETEDEEKEACETFETYLLSQEAQDIFAKYGFNPVTNTQPETQPVAPTEEVVQ